MNNGEQCEKHLFLQALFQMVQILVEDNCLVLIISIIIITRLDITRSSGTGLHNKHHRHHQSITNVFLQVFHNVAPAIVMTITIIIIIIIIIILIIIIIIIMIIPTDFRKLSIKSALGPRSSTRASGSKEFRRA